MKNSKKLCVADIKIEKFSIKGNGVGQIIQDQTNEAEISFAIPGEVVNAELRKRNGRWLGRIKEILEPSSKRIAPRCAHFGLCGGCRWQQMSYDDQLKYKEASVRNIFASMMTQDTIIKPIIGSSPWHFRNKMDFTFSSDLNRNKYLGLIMDSTKGKVVNVTECFLMNSWFLNALTAVRHWWEGSNLEAYRPLRNTGSLRMLTLREGVKTKDRMVVLTISGHPDFALGSQHLESFVAAIRSAIEISEGKLSIYLRIQQIEKGLPSNFYEMLLYGARMIEDQFEIRLKDSESTFFKFSYSPSVFFQPNATQAEKVISCAIEYAEINKNNVVYDLFCGTGAFGICASRMAKQVIGIEISPEAADDARKNAFANDCQNVKVISGAVRHVLNMQDEALPFPDVVFVDPPRQFDQLALRQLLDLNPPIILYLASDPQTQIEPLKEFLNGGYNIHLIQPFDQFPHTPHVQNLVLLRKIK